ncbi:MAG: hypothetical protein MJZ79_07180 [Paludibacteraceae bacterium]|nr:hypothetical protein [Paludibacteraceae bacterium]
MENCIFEKFCKGVVLCSTHDVVFHSQTNVQSVEKVIVITRNPPACHNISLLILEKELCGQKDQLISMLKESYGDNLLCILDLNGNKL